MCALAVGASVRLAPIYPNHRASDASQCATHQGKVLRSSASSYAEPSDAPARHNPRRTMKNPRGRVEGAKHPPMVPVLRNDAPWADARRALTATSESTLTPQ